YSVACEFQGESPRVSSPRSRFPGKPGLPRLLWNGQVVDKPASGIRLLCSAAAFPAGGFMRINQQSGQVLVGVAAALLVLTGFAGLAVDMGTLRYQKRLEQTAADGAAVAGAQNLANAFGGVTTGGLLAATQNGFTDNNSGAGCVGGAIGCISVA